MHLSCALGAIGIPSSRALDNGRDIGGSVDSCSHRALCDVLVPHDSRSSLAAMGLRCIRSYGDYASRQAVGYALFSVDSRQCGTGYPWHHPATMVRSRRSSLYHSLRRRTYE